MQQQGNKAESLNSENGHTVVAVNLVPSDHGPV